MSNGQKKGSVPVTRQLTPEEIKAESLEIATAAKRAVATLRRRAELAKRRSDRKPGDKTVSSAFLQAAQEFWAVTKVIQLATELGNQLNALKGVLEIMKDRDDALNGFEELIGKEKDKKPN